MPLRTSSPQFPVEVDLLRHHHLRGQRSKMAYQKNGLPFPPNRTTGNALRSLTGDDPEREMVLSEGRHFVLYLMQCVLHSHALFTKAHALHHRFSLSRTGDPCWRTFALCMRLCFRPLLKSTGIWQKCKTTVSWASSSPVRTPSQAQRVQNARHQ